MKRFLSLAILCAVMAACNDHDHDEAVSTDDLVPPTEGVLETALQAPTEGKLPAVLMPPV